MWFPGRIPRASFFLWLAVLKKLGTQDRMRGSTAQCILCQSQQESHDHLFFQCPVSMQIWRSVSYKGAFHVPTLVWTNLLSWLSINWKGNSFGMQMRKLCLSVTIYHIWKERNSRLHGNRPTRTEEVITYICEQIRLKVSTYRKVKDKPMNRSIQAYGAFRSAFLRIRKIWCEENCV